MLFLLLLLTGPLRAAELPKDALPVPLVRQATSYSCGAAALLSTLYYWRVYDGTESSLYARLGTTPQDGTEPSGLVSGAQSLGLSAELKEGLGLADLRAALKKGQTVLLDLQAWRTEGATVTWADTWEDGHYVVMVAMDKAYVYVMDPSSAGAYAYLPLAEFVERWHDYEDRHGARRVYSHTAILIGGKKHLKQVPAPLVRMD